MSEEIPAALEGVRFLRHHYLGPVSKLTPLGRLQAAWLLVVPDAVVLLSARGGVHRYIPLHLLDAVTVYPRGRLLLHIRSQHAALLAVPAQAPRLVALLEQLFAGLNVADGASGLKRTLAVHQSSQLSADDELLRLQPDPSFVNEVPAAFARSVAQARAAASQFGPVTTRDDGDESRELAAEAARRAAEESAATAPAAGASRSDKVAINEEERLTVLTIVSGQSSLTVPCPLRVWHYLASAANLLPGAQQPPTALLRCIDDNDAATGRDGRLINVMVVYQALAQCAARHHPHVVTLRKRSGETHNVPGELLWPLLLGNEL